MTTTNGRTGILSSHGIVSVRTIRNIPVPARAKYIPTSDQAIIRAIRDVILSPLISSHRDINLKCGAVLQE
jgi:hypothetical protein